MANVSLQSEQPESPRKAYTKLRPIMFGRESVISKKLEENGVYYEDFADLRIFFHTLENNFVSVKQVDELGKVFEVLKEIAFANIAMEMKVAPLAMVINKACKLSGTRAELPYLPAYIVSTEKCINGAVIIAIQSVRKQLAKRFGAFYVLPSSIHEVLVVPVFEHMSTEHEYLDMVRTINATELAPSEILSDNIYHCDENGEISVIRHA